jgi:hypothetical protein
LEQLPYQIGEFTETTVEAQRPARCRLKPICDLSKCEFLAAIIIW